MSLEAGTPQQHRGLWESTFESPSYAANFKEERGDRNIVHWKSVHDDSKVGRQYGYRLKPQKAEQPGLRDV